MTGCRQKVVFLTEAGPTIGVGHVHRCLALSEAMAVRGAETMFVVNETALSLVPALSGAGDAPNVLALPDRAFSDRTFGGVVDAVPDGMDWIVVDHYGVGPKTEKSLKQRTGAALAVVDDLCRNHDAALLIDGAPGRATTDYRPLADGVRLCGAGFAPLKSMFAQQRRRRAVQEAAANQTFHILVAFGGADPDGVTVQVVRALANLPDHVAITVVVGEGYRHRAGLDRAADVASQSGPRVTVQSGVDDMAALLARTDLAIGAGGVSSLERACLGVPSFLIEIAENQRDTIRGLVATGAAIEVTDIESDLARQVLDMIHDNGRHQKLSHAAAAVTDGRGAMRVAGAMLAPALDRNGRRVVIRPTCRDDSDHVLAWQSAPGARRFARDPNPPSPAAHRTWFDGALTDINRRTRTVEKDGRACGFLRMDPLGARANDVSGSEPDDLEVSILVPEEAQGSGIGAAALALAADEVRFDPAVPETKPRLWAYVKAENVASLRLFAKAGYRATSVVDWYLFDPDSSGEGSKA